MLIKEALITSKHKCKVVPRYSHETLIEEGLIDCKKITMYAMNKQVFGMYEHT